MPPLQLALSLPASKKPGSPPIQKLSLNPALTTNYRPITTIPFLLKIIDRVAYTQIQHYLESHRILGIRQSGFRPAHGTETALLDLKIQLDKTRDSGNMALLLLLDLSAAFDLVDHHTLCHHLTTAANFSPEATKWISSFLSDRTSRVYAGAHAATPTAVSCGVSQGSCVSPTLYNIYTKPLFDILDRLGIAYTNFADDTQILLPISGNYTTDSETITRTYETIQVWMATHHLCLNDEKTELLLVGTPARLKKLGPEFNSFAIDGNTIQVSKHVKTLGVYLDSELTMTRQVSAISSAAAYAAKLINLSRPFLSPANCLTLARAIIGAKIDYCNVLFTGTTTKNISKLQIIQNNSLRAALGIKRSDHITQARRDAHWLPVKARIEFKTLSIAHRCLTNTAPQYLVHSLTRNSSMRSLRSNTTHTLTVPRSNLRHAGGASFTTTAPTLWNSLPIEIRAEPSYWRFRKLLKTWLFDRHQ